MADIRINLVIKAAPKDVYTAITTQDGLTSWWCKQTVAKAQTGFVNEFTFGNFRNQFEITELSPAKKVDWKCISSIDEWIGTHVTFDLQEKDGNTLLRFAQSGYKAVTDKFAHCTYDWSRFMASLKSLCETGVGSPS